MVFIAKVIFILVSLQFVNSKSLKLQIENNSTVGYLNRLQKLFSEIIASENIERCIVVITDEIHYNSYDQRLGLRSKGLHSQFFLKVDAHEDLLAPHYQSVRVLAAVHASNCDLHLVTLSNGIQVKRFLHFVYRYRILNMRQKYVFLYDKRLLDADMLHIWSSLEHSAIIKPVERGFSLYTIPYSSILNGIVAMQQLLKWRQGARLKRAQLFPDKSSNLNGALLPVAVVEHVPMVSRNSDDSDGFEGVEVEIVRVLAETLNFKPIFQTLNDSETERWGRQLPNGSYTGLIGQMENHFARLAIGDLHLNNMHSSVIDLSVPHSAECLTFLTPESSQDNSWRTLIQPFSGGMWIGVLLSLFMVGTLFYFMSWIHTLALNHHPNSSLRFFAFLRQKPSSSIRFDSSLLRDVKFRNYLNRIQVEFLPKRSRDLFDSFPNCILLTYSMMMYVSLPHMPRNWPLRVLTGWYWIYCILLTVTYRANFTAILANPSTRITIDTLQELAESRIITNAWGDENQKFFLEAFDSVAQQIGLKMEQTDDIYGVIDKIASGTHAYYDNEFHLRHLRVLGRKRREDEKVLHIMRECVVLMPIVLGLEKNSPLTPHIDKQLQHLREGGLLSKWLKDAIKSLPAEEEDLPEALMDLRKFWSSFIALGIGYLLSMLAILAEYIHFNHVVQAHPLYDKYNPRLYYDFKAWLKNN